MGNIQMHGILKRWAEENVSLGGGGRKCEMTRSIKAAQSQCLLGVSRFGSYKMPFSNTLAAHAHHAEGVLGFGE